MAVVGVVANIDSEKQSDGQSANKFARNMMAKTPKIAIDVWMMVDWTKTANQIAKELGVHPNRVYYWAQKVGKTPAPSPRGPRPSTDWKAGVDWSNPNNADLGRIHGVSGEWVSKMRERYAPETVVE